MFRFATNDRARVFSLSSQARLRSRLEKSRKLRSDKRREDFHLSTPRHPSRLLALTPMLVVLLDIPRFHKYNGKPHLDPPPAEVEGGLKEDSRNGARSSCLLWKPLSPAYLLYLSTQSPAQPKPPASIYPTPTPTRPHRVMSTPLTPHPLCETVMEYQQPGLPPPHRLISITVGRLLAPVALLRIDHLVSTGSIPTEK